MYFKRPRIVIAGLRGGSGKTILSLGLIAAWREQGLEIAPFKKGPDFIDAGWMAFAAGRSCHNLDPFLMRQEQLLDSFLSHSGDVDLSIVEGNRGIFDGLDLEGQCSTAELARLISSPVILILDVTMATRTLAAVLKGCQVFDPQLDIAGVILNRVAGSRQENLVRKSIEKYCGIPVLGSIPKLKDGIFPERHMGLVPYQESNHAEKAISWARDTVRENLQLDEIRLIASRAGAMFTEVQGVGLETEVPFGQDAPRIGFIRDKSFWFYYPENLERLEKLGAELVEIDALCQSRLPDVDALYIGGGFPETQAEALAENTGFRESLREEIKLGLPVYAECGGFMYLGEKLIVHGKAYPMVGALPIEFILHAKPQGHGYTILDVEQENPYYQVGDTLKGHEFHYSQPVFTGNEELDMVFKVKRGHGVNGLRDGVCVKNLLATYTHVHAGGNCPWARGFINATKFGRRRK